MDLAVGIGDLDLEDRVAGLLGGSDLDPRPGGRRVFADRGDRAHPEPKPVRRLEGRGDVNILRRRIVFRFLGLDLQDDFLARQTG